MDNSHYRLILITQILTRKAKFQRRNIKVAKFQNFVKKINVVMCGKYCLANTMMRKLGNFVRVYLLHIATFLRFYHFYEVVSRNLVFTTVFNGNCPSRVLILETACNAHCETHSHHF
jgi:hypothetical protein